MNPERPEPAFRDASPPDRRVMFWGNLAAHSSLG
jgi:hypothetical protein